MMMMMMMMMMILKKTINILGCWIIYLKKENLKRIPFNP